MEEYGLLRTAGNEFRNEEEKLEIIQMKYKM